MNGFTVNRQRLSRTLNTPHSDQEHGTWNAFPVAPRSTHLHPLARRCRRSGH